MYVYDTQCGSWIVFPPTLLLAHIDASTICLFIYSTQLITMMLSPQ